jgi:RNA polymerase sigma factor (sigma-70 family)
MPLTQTQLSLLQQSDAKSQRELYELYKARIMGLCRRYSRCKEEAEDIFQETFIRVFQGIRQLRDAEHLDPWIRKIAVNAAVNYYHKTKRHEHADERNGHSHANSDYELILSHFTDEQLVGLVNNLPDGYRMVFNMHELEGYSHAEIAKMLHISETTSRSQLNRAKQALKNKLRAFGILKYEKYA